MPTPPFRSSTGLSLLELALLITILVVILSIAIPATVLRGNIKARQDAPQSVREGDVRALKKALDWRTSPNQEFFEEWTGPDGTVTPMHYSLLSYAVKHEQEEVVALLIEYEADVNGQIWGTDRPPLFWAAWTGNEAIFDMLIEAGADINAVVVGKTALGYAKDGYPDAAKFLTERDAE